MPRHTQMGLIHFNLCLRHRIFRVYFVILLLSPYVITVQNILHASRFAVRCYRAISPAFKGHLSSRFPKRYVYGISFENCNESSHHFSVHLSFLLPVSSLLDLVISCSSIRSTSLERIDAQDGNIFLQSFTPES